MPGDAKQISWLLSAAKRVATVTSGRSTYVPRVCVCARMCLLLCVCANNVGHTSHTSLVHPLRLAASAPDVRRGCWSGAPGPPAITPKWWVRFAEGRWVSEELCFRELGVSRSRVVCMCVSGSCV